MNEEALVAHVIEILMTSVGEDYLVCGVLILALGTAWPMQREPAKKYDAGLAAADGHALSCPTATDGWSSEGANYNIILG